MSKQQAAVCWTIGVIVGTAGVFLLLDQLTWKTIVGLALLLWGNNLSQVRHER